MKVSIIVPVYKVEEYIQRCFDSIKNQTYTTIECIFVDDCSPDNCYEILKQSITEYSGPIEFRIIRHEQNKGLSGARNTGTLAATGEYIYYLDSDDEITHDCIDTLVNLANKYPGVEMVQGNTKTIPQPVNDWRDISLINFPEYVNNNLWIKKHYIKVPCIPVNAWNKLVKRRFLIDNKLIFKEGIIHEDVHWMFFVSKKLNCIAFSEKYCYVHFINPGSIMQSGNNHKSLESKLEIFKDFTLNVDSSLSKIQRKYIFYSLKNIMLKIDNNSDEKKFISQYRGLFWSIMMESIKSCRIFEFLSYSVLLMPKFIYKSYFGRIISGIFIRLV